MCLIVDANCAAKFSSGDAEAAPIAKWLEKKTSRLAVGGSKLGGEYAKLKKFAAVLVQLDARGQLKRCDGGAVDELQSQLESAGNLASDDPHIIALALISGARVLYSNDQALHADFGSSKILQPKGSIYQNPSHAHLLVGASC